MIDTNVKEVVFKEERSKSKIDTLVSVIIIGSLTFAIGITVLTYFFA